MLLTLYRKVCKFNPNSEDALAHRKNPSRNWLLIKTEPLTLTEFACQLLNKALGHKTVYNLSKLIVYFHRYSALKVTIPPKKRKFLNLMRGFKPGASVAWCPHVPGRAFGSYCSPGEQPATGSTERHCSTVCPKTPGCR